MLDILFQGEHIYNPVEATRDKRDTLASAVELKRVRENLIMRQMNYVRCFPDVRFFEMNNKFSRPLGTIMKQ